jgi:peptide/nickel transport system substrate-binding protein
MSTPLIRSIVAALALVAAVPSLVDAKPIRWARSADALTLDPHAQNEGPTHTMLHQLYEPLVQRTIDGKLLPTLAVSWMLTADPTVWEFKLRPNVKFHNGEAFSADDVVFSINRSLQPTSDMKGAISFVESVTKVDDLTVNIKTKGPNPLVPDTLTNTYIMSKAWSEANNTTTVQDYKEKKDNFAVRNANGTGAYKLVSREQDVKTVLARNDAYWSKGTIEHGIEEVTYITIKSDATRVAALLSGEVDIVQDVPTQDIDRLMKTPGIRVNTGPENRTIFFGMDVGSPELKTSDVKGKNPFADLRVRQAINMSIDRTAINKAVMRGQSVPAGIIAPPFVNGYTKDLDVLPKVDLDGAKKLLADAGYPNGFSVTLNCPNDRYINDEAICQAAVSMLAKIGIKVNLSSGPKGPHFNLIQKQPPETEFYMLGWGVPTYDSHYVFSYLYQTRSGKDGTWNAMRYTNTDADKLIASLTTEVDLTKRNATVAEIWKILHPATLYIPLHHQTLAFAMKDMWDIPTSPENRIDMKFYGAKK